MKKTLKILVPFSEVMMTAMVLCSIYFLLWDSTNPLLIRALVGYMVASNLRLLCTNSIIEE